MEARGAFSSLSGRRYISLATFRKNGARVLTPVWFAHSDRGTIFVMTRSDSGKMKRIRNRPQVELAPSNIRGRPLGPFVAGIARLAEDPRQAQQCIRSKYLLAQIPFLWSRNNIFLEIFPRSA